jgi:hypothetical protein
MDSSVPDKDSLPLYGCIEVSAVIEGEFAKPLSGLPKGADGMYVPEVSVAMAGANYT